MAKTTKAPRQGEWDSLNKDLSRYVKSLEKDGYSEAEARRLRKSLSRFENQMQVN